MKAGDVQGKGYDLQITGDSALPVLTLVDSQHGITIGGMNIGKDALVINEDHSKHKGFLPDAESGITNSRRAPLEVQ